MVSGVQVTMAWSSQLTVVSSPGGQMVQHSGQRPWWPDGATPSSAATPSPDTFGTGGCSEINMNQSLRHRTIYLDIVHRTVYMNLVHTVYMNIVHRTVHMNITKQST